MLLSAVSVLVVAQSSSEIPEGLMNNPVYIGYIGLFSFEYEHKLQWVRDFFFMFSLLPIIFSGSYEFFFNKHCLTLYNPLQHYQSYSI